MFNCEHYKKAPDSLKMRYRLYVECATGSVDIDTGKPLIIKTFIEWINS